jgi:polyhydroxyalkanoate synthase
LLTIIAENDTIAPPKSSEALAGVVGSSDLETFRFDAGHIGLSTSSKGRKQFWPRIAGWIARHSELVSAEDGSGA